MELDEILNEINGEIDKLGNNIDKVQTSICYTYDLPLPEGLIMKPDGELFYYSVTMYETGYHQYIE